MSLLIDIEWIGPDRDIPVHGRMTKGKVINLPTSIGESYIKQKLAKAATKLKKSEG